MINLKDVITIKIPYPDLENDLALTAHMYICIKRNINTLYFVQCQRVKLYMKKSNYKDIKNFIDEEPNIQRNPFKFETRINCDKLFFTKSSRYDNALKTNPGISNELYESIMDKLNNNQNDIEEIHLDEEKLWEINKRFTALKKISTIYTIRLIY
ncbi:hypothetical protein [Mycoplasma bradburyae]|uniref:Uncharacterized protein n=1 Tax=Mycoplasma bradburyae TaxID=2963128 RepID=A0ABT5GAL3_9MOLU|nr:hypothetical protein [Mycoplasma bradburyae]MDC4181933.1 hypothetical protein [Mycoplasma bradburyae]UTS70358.1 hypothetical protein NMG68_01295 [Mycoplasma bradburyae]